MKNQETPKVKGKNWNKIMEREIGEDYFFIKEKCFVCGSLSHLIKDCDFYEKKMAREAELKKQRVFNTGNGVAKPVWNNANRVNRANHFIPRPVQLNVVRSNVNTDLNNQYQPKNSNMFYSPVRPPGETEFKTKKLFFTITFQPGEDAIVRKYQQEWTILMLKRKLEALQLNLRQDHPLKNIEDRGIFDSGCSRHMTGNKDHLNGFEECKWGSVTFGGSKGYITSRADDGSPDFMKNKAIQNSSKQGRNLQKDESEVFETPKQGKSSGETDISPQVLELSEAQKKRMAQVQEAAQFYTKEDWDTIQAKLEAIIDLVKEIAGEDVSEADYAQRMVGLISQRRKLIAEKNAKAQRDKPMTQAQQRQYMAIYLKNQEPGKGLPMDTEKESRKRTGIELQTESSKKLKSDTREDVSVPKEKDKESVKREEEFGLKSQPEEEFERVLWGDLKTMFDPPSEEDAI
ncbi:hypothetical protein Tco_0427655 [Tanacetum coccineum]